MVGFHVCAAPRLTDYIVDPGSDVATLRSEAGRGASAERLGDPIYLVLEKS